MSSYEESTSAVAQKCYCGEPNCKGFIGGVLEEDGGDEDGSGPRISVTDDEDDTDTPETLKKTRKKPGRKRVPRPLKDPDEVQTFVKKMLDSVGKVHLVNKLLQSLELTTADTPVGKDVLKKFIRLHGLKILKIWLGEWKNNDDVVSKVCAPPFKMLRGIDYFATEGASSAQPVASGEPKRTGGLQNVRCHTEIRNA